MSAIFEVVWVMLPEYIFSVTKSGMNETPKLILVSRIIGITVYVLASVVLTLYALIMIGISIWKIVHAIFYDGSVVRPILDAVSLLVISIAVFDIKNFVTEH